MQKRRRKPYWLKRMKSWKQLLFKRRSRVGLRVLTRVSQRFCTGSAEAELKTKELLENLDRLVKGAVQQRTNALAQLEHDFLKMSVIIAEKIIRKKLSEGDISWLEPTIQECMANLSLADRVTIRLHPKAYEAMLEAGIKFNDFRTNITWEPDEAVEFGGCILKQAGRIDACLETRLNSVNALEEAVYRS